VGNGIGQRSAQVESGFFKGLDGNGISLFGQGGDQLGFKFGEGNFPESTLVIFLCNHFKDGSFNTRSRDIGFQATPFPATTLTSIILDPYVSQFPGKAILTIDQATIDHQSASQSGSQGDHNKVLKSFGISEEHLPESSSIGIIGNHCRKAELFFHELHKRNDPFPAQVRSMFNGSGVVISVGSSHTDSTQLHLFVQFPNALFYVTVKVFNERFYTFMFG